jgi:hypothetical protein
MIQFRGYRLPISAVGQVDFGKIYVSRSLTLSIKRVVNIQFMIPICHIKEMKGT